MSDPGTFDLAAWTAALARGPEAARAATVGDAIGAGDLVRALVALSEERAEGWLVANRALLGASSADRIAKRWREAIARATKDAERAERLDRAVALATSPVLVGEALGRDDLPRLELPTNWTIDGGGRLLERTAKDDGEIVESVVSHRAIVTTGVLEDDETGDRAVMLEWPGERPGDAWGCAVVPAAQTQDPRSFLPLRNRGAPVAGHSAKHLARFLDALEATNATTIPRAHHASRLGWQGEGGARGFLWGRTLLAREGDLDGDAPPTAWGPDHVRLAIGAEDGRAQVADGCTAEGSLEGWREVASLALPYPRALLGIYASLASCFLGLIPAAPNAIVDWSGETSRGKTTTLVLAASVWGRPLLEGAGVMRTWDTTPAALEQVASLMTHLPLILDDTKRAPTAERGEGFVASMIYQIAAKQGRARARPDGMRRTSTWRTLLLSTGEAAATSFTQDAGARARVLAIRGSPFPEGSAGVVAEIRAGMLRHFGHAGPALIRRIVADPSRPARLRASFAEGCERWAAEIGDAGAVGGRLAEMLALLELGQEAAHVDLALPHPEIDPIREVALVAVREGAADADRPADALRAVYAWAVAHSAEFFGRHRSEIRNGEVIDLQPARGWAGVWRRAGWVDIAFEPEALRRILAHQGGFSYSDVVPRWNEREWLIRDGKNLCAKRGVGGDKVRMVCVKIEALRHVGALEVA